MPRRPGALPPELSVRKTGAPITFLTRKDCPLCHEARRIVENAARRYKLAIETVDLDREPADVFERFKNEIPVIMIDGKRHFSGHVSASLLERALKSRKP